MARLSAPALVAFALVAALACAAAAFAAEHLGIGSLPAGLVVGVIALGYAACGLGVIHHARLAAERDAEELDDLSEMLARSTSEVQSRRVLLRYVQRLAPDAGTVLLTAGDPSNGLELTFGERIVDTPLLGLSSARFASETCRAMELGQPREVSASASEEPTTCALCGRLATELACEPLRAAPVLALHHNQTAVERRAGSDPVTTLPNRPAAEQTLRRLCAQAGRTISPVTAVLLAIDQPPRLRSERERALAIVGRRLTGLARASDYVASFDTSTFLVLAPDTDREGGLELAEKLRRELEQLPPGSDGRLTASLGVAALPMDALAPDDLLRQADRALAVAKALGGNRVQPAESTLAP